MGEYKYIIIYSCLQLVFFSGFCSTTMTNNKITNNKTQPELNLIVPLNAASFRLFTKLVLEAPIITESALDVIRRYCEDEVSNMIEDPASHTQLVPCTSSQL